jgi:hypothetical protein
MDTHDLVERSHGKNSTFAFMVNRAWREMMEPEGKLFNEHLNFGFDKEEWHGRMRHTVRQAWPKIEAAAKEMRVPTRTDRKYQDAFEKYNPLGR